MRRRDLLDDTGSFIVDVGIKYEPLTKSDSQEVIPWKGREEKLFENWVCGASGSTPKRVRPAFGRVTGN